MNHSTGNFTFENGAERLQEKSKEALSEEKQEARTGLHTCDPSSWEAEASGCDIQGQLELPENTDLINKTKQTKESHTEAAGSCKKQDLSTSPALLGTGALPT